MIKKIALVTVAALLLTACQMNQDQAKNQPDKQHPGTKTESPAYKEIDAAKEVNAYHEIEELLEKEQPQWPQVRQVYEGKLRSIVQGRSPEADQLIDAYLNAGQSGQAKVKEVEEVVLKTLQRSAYEGIKTILKEKSLRRWHITIRPPNCWNKRKPCMRECSRRQRKSGMATWVPSPRARSIRRSRKRKSVACR